MTTTMWNVLPPGGSEPARLSVVLAVTSGFHTIRTTMRHLRAQSVSRAVQVVVVAPAAARVQIPLDAVAGLHSCVIVEVTPWETMSVSKAHALGAATAPLVAFAEDHSFPEPGWAEALVAAHAHGYAGIGAQMCNANPESVLSWASMFMNFGEAVEPAACTARYTSASHNTSYDRAALLSLGAELPRLMQAELFLQDALLARGHRLCREPAARTHHVNITRVRPWLAHLFLGGRLYGALRAELGSWSPGRRALYAGGAPLVPLLRIRRTVRDIRRTSHRSALLPRVLPALALGLTVHAAGECAGYVLGMGQTEARYSAMELNRWSAVHQRDRNAWA